MMTKVLSFTILILLLNPHPLISDAQMWGATRRESPVLAEKTARLSPASPVWTCFHSEQITIEQSEVLYNGNPVSMPEMQIRAENHWYQVSLSGDVQGDYDSIFARWQELIQGSQNVCISMETLQSLDSVDGLPSSLSVVHGLKTDRGEWNE
jgi:hypothetical protein